MVKVQVFLIICYAAVSWAIRCQLTYYTELDCKGDGLILESKQANVIPEAPRVIAASKSVFVAGNWRGWENVNFTGEWRGATSFDNQPPRCVNTTSFQDIKSIRFQGPAETTSNSLSFYELPMHSGREVTITGPATANIPFVPAQFLFTGTTSWTLYSGSDFDGIATCFTPSEYRWYDSYVPNSTVRSILRGCERHIDYYIYEGDEEDTLTLA